MTFKPPFANDALTYGFEWLRYAAELGSLQEGVVGPGDLKVTAAAAGGMRVDVAAGTAMVKGDSGTPGTGVSQGLYTAVNPDAIPNAVTHPSSNGSSPRVDQIALRVRDQADLGTGANDLTLVCLSGSATAGATLDNRLGVASLPNDHLRLADVLIPAGSTAVSAGNIRDRRPWARGARTQVISPGTASATSTSASIADTGLASHRVELSGGPVTLTVFGWGQHSINNADLRLGVFMDGASIDNQQYTEAYVPVAGRAFAISGVFSGPPVGTVGSHTFSAAFANVSGTGTGTLLDTSSNRVVVQVMEEIRRPATNG